MEKQSTNIRRRGRPPKRLDEQFDTREMLLRAGVEVLTEKGGSLGIPVEATRCSVSLMPVASLKMPDPPECVGRNASHPTTHSSGA